MKIVSWRQIKRDFVCVCLLVACCCGIALLMDNIHDTRELCPSRWLIICCFVWFIVELTRFIGASNEFVELTRSTSKHRHKNYFWRNLCEVNHNNAAHSIQNLIDSVQSMTVNLAWNHNKARPNVPLQSLHKQTSSHSCFSAFCVRFRLFSFLPCCESFPISFAKGKLISRHL